MTFAGHAAARGGARGRAGVGAAADVAHLRRAGAAGLPEDRRAVRDGDDGAAGRLGRARQHDSRVPALGRRARRRVRGHRTEVVLLGPDVRRLRDPRPDGARALVLAGAALAAGRHAQRLPPPAAQGQAGQPLERLGRGRVRRRPGRVWWEKRAAASRTIMEMVSHARLECLIASAAIMRQAVAQATHHAAHRAAFGRSLQDHPLMQNVLADLALESEAATATALRLARAYDERPRDERRAALRAVRHAARQVLDLQAHAAGRRPRPSNAWAATATWRIASFPVSTRGARELRLGGLRQRDVSRRPARAHTRARERGRVLRRARPRPPESTGGSTHSWRRSATSWRGGRRWRPERAASSSTWPSRSRPRCLVRQGQPAVADAFLASRIAGDGGLAFGTLPARGDFKAIVERARPV